MRRVAGLAAGAPRRSVTAAVGALGLVVLGLAVLLVTGLPGSSRGASRPPKASGSASVQTRTLVQTDTESGTLGYAKPQTVFNRLSGTITSLPSVGQVIKPGQTLYKVSGAPVVLMNGTVPAYRDLSAGVSDGPDAQQLKQNLVALGFDPEHQITINQTFDAATTTAVDLWQASLGETPTGTVTLGQVVFLPGTQRITTINAVLGSTGGASGSGSSGSGSSGSGSGTSTGASTLVAPAQPVFVSLTKAVTAPTSSVATPCPTGTVPNAAGKTPKCKPKSGSGSGSGSGTGPGPGKAGSGTPTTLAALLALLKAETTELQKSKSSTPSTGAAAGGKATSGSSSSAGASRGSGGGASATGASTGTGASSGGSGAASSGASSAGGTAQAILQTTSTQLVVTVNLDATKQSEAVVGAPVTVQLPDGSTVNGKVTRVSPVAQTSSSSSSTAGSAAGSSTPSATIPVTITVARGQHVTGLDQAAVSVNFQQQVARNVLSVPVTALLATAGGGYAVQEAASPNRLIPVTPGLFAAGYVAISGSGIAPGLSVTDSQG